MIDGKGNLCVLEDFDPFERIQVHVDGNFPLQLVCNKKIFSYLSIYVYHLEKDIYLFMFIISQVHTLYRSFLQIIVVSLVGK